MQIARVFYFDTYYLYTEEYAVSRFRLDEAFGYMHDCGSYIKISFIDDYSENSLPRGLLIPKQALANTCVSFYNDKLAKLTPGTKLTVEWDDIVHVTHDAQAVPSVMRTAGIVTTCDGNKVVIENPTTHRIAPIESHDPHPLSQPRFMVIPCSLIRSAEATDVNAVSVPDSFSYPEELSENRIVEVQFSTEGSPYRAVGVLVRDSEDAIRIGFSAHDNNLVDYLDINRANVSAIRDVNTAEIQNLGQIQK